VVTDCASDSLDSHVGDTLLAGDGLCDERVVKFVVNQARERLADLVTYGVNFDRDSEGKLLLGREGGHQHHRIVHCKDSTGSSISSALLKKIESLTNIVLLTNHVVVDLITTRLTGEPLNTCQGAIVLDLETGTVTKYIARVTILATGGIGQLYSITTNPLIATGDGIALAWRAGAKVSKMEFIQFHPTALASFDNPHFLISEAVRGYGAHLINELGERFMFRYHPDGELACRDVVARAIATEISMGQSKEVYLDCTHIAHSFRNEFPTIYGKCLSLGLDLFFNPIPVVPAAHYLCGGIEVDLNSRTTIENLYACGECSNTGLHGANRLASNSLLEAVVFANSCYLDVAKRLDRININPLLYDTHWVFAYNQERNRWMNETRTALKELMTDNVGIVRSNRGLTVAWSWLSEINRTVSRYWRDEFVDPELCELRNMIDVASLIVAQSIARKENRGGFFNVDLEKYNSVSTS
jgi:L-aspartate oxidase